MFDAEEFWKQILSREPKQIQKAYLALPDDDEREAVYAHLQNMASEDDDGWSEPQRISAAAAIEALEFLRNDDLPR
ncbi:MAG TPA: hypothetical protein VJZ27_15315 [Aggregatilineales bacterium]|nr:hypothetical protein [Aggregatilineales bacterium]